MRLPALAVLGSLSILSAAIRPSLDIETSSWNATDILVLSPTADKGSFRVVESIKGDTSIGTVLVLNELAPADDVAQRPLRELIDRKNPFSASASNLTVPPIAESDRMIVFLRRPGALPEYDSIPDIPVSTDGWQPVDRFGGFSTAAIWLQGGVAYGFVQNVNPGPSHLVELRQTEDKIRDEIQTVLRLRDALDRALANPDAVTRCKEIAALVQPKWRIAKFSALKHLEGGGAAAAAALIDLLADRTLLEVHAYILEALVKLGAQDLDLGPLLQEETHYWSQACRSFQVGWLNNAVIHGDETPRSHYLRVHAILRAIGKLHLAKNLPQVQEFVEAWMRCPPMDENKASTENQVSEECDLLLSAAPSRNDP